jgi:thiamine-monophosphate kinase
LIFVSGNLGDAKIGLDLKLGKKLNFTNLQKKYFLERHFFPTPRIELGEKLLAKKLSKCAIDVSDGLLADLRHLCVNSKLSAEIFLDKIPFSAAVEKLSQEEKLELLSGGDDYELIFAVDPKNEKKILELSKLLKLRLTCIGKFKENAKSAITLLNLKNQKIRLKKFGYEHI